jgi:hypothetical protein
MKGAPMDALTTGVLLLGIGVFVLLMATVLTGRWRRALWEDSPLLLHQMLERHGIEISASENLNIVGQAARAARRCAGCSDATRCRAWLDSAATEGYEHFCPNASFIDFLK